MASDLSGNDRRGGGCGDQFGPFDGVPALTARQFSRVLVGWDGSLGSAAALLAATEIASSEQARVVALAVLHPVGAGEGEADQADLSAGPRHQAEESFHKARDLLPAEARSKVTLALTEGTHPADVLCDYADSHVFGLIVLGRHGTGGLFHPQLGHVAHSVVKKSGIPVLVLNGPD